MDFLNVIVYNTSASSLISFSLKLSLLAARNERESVQIAIRPKVSWAGSSIAGTVQVQCTDLCSTSGDRCVSNIKIWSFFFFV